MTRSEGDSWDLGSSVGATATAVAASRALAAQGPNPLIDDPFADPLVRAVDVDFFTKMLDGEIELEDDPAFNRQRMTEGMAVRTRFFDEFFRTAAEAGVRQAVILAAGLDTRAYRLPWPAGTVVYELDQPDVIEFKTRTLAGLGAAATAGHRAVAVDLRDDWPAALRADGFDTQQPTAWIAEGLLVYLPPDAQDRLFDHITALSAPSSRLATEHVPDTRWFTDERARRRTELLQQQGLELDMAELVYHDERRQVTDYLPARGWSLTTSTVEEMFTANGFEMPDDDEMAAAAAEVRYVTATLS